MVDAIFESHQLQRGHDMLAALLRIQLGQQQGQLHVFKGSQNRNQVKRLKHIPDVFVAPAGGLRVVEAEDVLSLYQQFTLGRPVDGRNHVQQGGLTRAGRTHERHELAGGNIDRNVIECFYLEGIPLENLADAANLNHSRSGGHIGFSDCAHDCPLILIFCPSFRSAGPAVTTSSPPFKPWSKTPPLRCAVTCTGLSSTLPLKTMKTTFLPERSRTALVGTKTLGGPEAVAVFAGSSAMNFTVEFISGRK